MHLIKSESITNLFHRMHSFIWRIVQYWSFVLLLAQMWSGIALHFSLRLVAFVYQGVLDLAQLPDHAHHLITLVLGIDIAQGMFLWSVFILLSMEACNNAFNWSSPGPIRLLQDGKVITLFPLGGKLSTPDHQEVLPGRGMVNRSVGLILLLMAMVLNRIKAMDMLSESIHFLFSFFTWLCVWFSPLLVSLHFVLSFYEKEIYVQVWGWCWS